MSEIQFQGRTLDIPLSKGESGEYALHLKTWLKDIMYGKEEHEWGVIIDEVNPGL